MSEKCPSNNEPLQKPHLSTRDTLKMALQFAKEGVEIDSSAVDPPRAILAYTRCNGLLREVMDALTKEEKEYRQEESKRLKSVHDAYASRIEFLKSSYLNKNSMTNTPASGRGKSLFSMEKAVRVTEQAQRFRNSAITISKQTRLRRAGVIVAWSFLAALILFYIRG